MAERCYAECDIRALYVECYYAERRYAEYCEALFNHSFYLKIVLPGAKRLSSAEFYYSADDAEIAVPGNPY